MALAVHFWLMKSAIFLHVLLTEFDTGKFLLNGPGPEIAHSYTKILTFETAPQNRKPQMSSSELSQSLCHVLRMTAHILKSDAKMLRAIQFQSTFLYSTQGTTPLRCFTFTHDLYHQ